MARLFTFLFLFIGILLTGNVAAQPELDTTFGTTGGLLLNNSGFTEDIAVQPDGKVLILAACRTINFPNNHPFCVERTNENGSRDTTFGNFSNGTAYTLVPGVNPSESVANFSTGIALQSDNKILAVGVATVSVVEHPVFVRYDSNGILDSTFGTGGFIITPIIGRAMELVIQPDGKFLVVGIKGTSPNYQHFVARYFSDGTIDTSFGSNGISTFAVSGNAAMGLSIALQPDGKILTGGSLTTLPGAPTPSESYLLTRLNRDGSLDTTFDNDGFKTIPFGTTPDIFLSSFSATTRGFLAVAIQTDGRILALGYSNILYRFNPDGTLDTSFDGDGSREALNGNSGSSDVYDLTVTPGGKITVVGHPTIPAVVTINYRVARYLPNGSPDSGFSNDGFLDINATFQSVDGAKAVALDSRGRIVIGGQSAVGVVGNPWENRLFSAVRLIASPAQNVGISGRIVNLDGRPVINAFIALQSGGTTIKAGRTNQFGYFSFQNVQSGQTYNISVKSKGLVFSDRSLLVDDAITNLTIFGKRVSSN
jgi:uncharacterized delta-60 repeat protein